ncbi:hypothetical protein [Sulfurimonas sp.]|uniref:hypothetical protein n=1 Tax=Sulfurimonas sp. TaxID=2022749 RepID=UPI003D14C08C
MTTLSLKEAAKHLCFSTTWMYRNLHLFKRGKHYLHLHGKYVFIKEALDTWLIEKDKEDALYILTREKEYTLDQTLSQWKSNQEV